jgi:4,5-dihydroxyphthalate decarboxylase
MASIHITIACGDYDRTRAIAEGSVSVEGCEVTYLRLQPEEAFHRAFGHQEFDVTELSFSYYLIARSSGSWPYIGIPVFPSRMFRHSAIYIRTERGIERPEDLKGRVVGVPEYSMTAAVWVRGMLQDEYGVKPADIEWRTGGLEEPGRGEMLKVNLPSSLHVKRVEEKALSDMLSTGELDALITARAPSCFTKGNPNVTRLFKDFRSAEKTYFAKTGLFPIMHLIGIRESLVERYPWIATSLYKAFRQAKAACLADLDEVVALPISLPWVSSEVEETKALMGENFWPYGVKENGKTLEAITRYSYEQGLSARRLPVEELFVPATLGVFKI